MLHRLSLHGRQRYAALKPAEVEGNLFMYHLNRLIADGLVAKHDGVYTLTTAGRHLVERTSFGTMRPSLQPKVVTMIVGRNDQGHWLLYRRRRQPFTNLVSFPSGKLHLGETIQQAATRELQEKANLQATLRHRGEVYLTVYHDSELVTQMLCHVFAARAFRGTIRSSRAAGRCFWEETPLPAAEQVPWLGDIRRLVTGRSGRFFHEFSYQI